MKVNENISFETLKGLILRANNDERLEIADEWLRGNKVVSIPQYQEIREIWNKMVKKFGKHEIIISCGTVKHTYMQNLTFSEANRICREQNWQHNHNNGLMWDMSVEWQG